MWRRVEVLFGKTMASLFRKGGENLTRSV